MSKTRRMVVGFLFNEKRDHVLLILKDHGPAFMVGKLNGLGGAIEGLECAEDAMRREFREEAGADVTKWREFALLEPTRPTGLPPEWAVHCFVAFDDHAFEYARPMTREGIARIRVPLEPDGSIVPNVRWMVAMALDETLVYATVYER